MYGCIWPLCVTYATVRPAYQPGSTAQVRRSAVAIYMRHVPNGQLPEIYTLVLPSSQQSRRLCHDPGATSSVAWLPLMIPHRAPDPDPDRSVLTASNHTCFKYECDPT
eukprot:361440-Chlamydomonas_euryale.AAC.4